VCAAQWLFVVVVVGATVVVVAEGEKRVARSCPAITITDAPAVLATGATAVAA